MTSSRDQTQSYRRRLICGDCVCLSIYYIHMYMYMNVVPNQSKDKEVSGVSEREKERKREHRVSRCRVKIRGGSLLFLQRSFPACSLSSRRLTIGSIDFSRLLRHFYRTVVGFIGLIGRCVVEKRARLSLRGRTQMKMQTKITSKLKRLVSLCYVVVVIIMVMAVIIVVSDSIL